MHPTKKEIILACATKIFAEKGFLNATISEIASDAGVGDATIYSFFSSKEELLLALPENAFVDFINSIESHLKGLSSPEEKLRKIVWHFLDFYQSNKDYAKIYVMELSGNASFYTSKANDHLRKYAKIVLEIIQEGQEKGIFGKDINPYFFRSMIFGFINNLVLTWFVFNRPKDLLESLDDILKIILNAIRP